MTPREQKVRLMYEELEMTREELLDSITGLTSAIEMFSGLPMAEDAVALVRHYRAVKIAREAREEGL